MMVLILNFNGSRGTTAPRLELLKFVVVVVTVVWILVVVVVLVGVVGFFVLIGSGDLRRLRRSPPFDE